MSAREEILYDCDDCPAFCCSVYERVEVRPGDLRRLAKYFGVSEEVARERYTTTFEEDELILLRKDDDLFGETCEFLDTETRGCTIYDARPAICRKYPARERCSYYDLYQFEQEQQGDPEAIPLIQLTFRKHKPDPKPEPPPKKRRISKRKSKPANDVSAGKEQA